MHLLEFIQFFFIFFTSYFFYLRIMKHTIQKLTVAGGIILFIIFALLFVSLQVHFVRFLAHGIVLSLFALILYFFTRKRLGAHSFAEKNIMSRLMFPKTVVTVSLMSYGMSIGFSYIGKLAGVLIGLNDYLQTAVIVIFHILAASRIFVGMFKDGFSHLLPRYSIFGALGLTGFIVALDSILYETQEIQGSEEVLPYIMSVLLFGFAILVWGRQLLVFERVSDTAARNSDKILLEAEDDKMKYEATIAEKDEDIAKLSEVNDDYRKMYHTVNQRFDAMEWHVKKLSSSFSPLNEEYSSEIGIMNDALNDALNEIKRLSDEFERRARDIKSVVSLPATGIAGADRLFGYYHEKCARDGIDFQLNVKGKPDDLEKLAISYEDIEILISNHIENAVKAVLLGNAATGRIYIIFSYAQGNLALEFFDSGIDFEMETLITLGLKRVTTHEDAGGTGIGFMDTFKILDKHKASIIIKENAPNSAPFTKSITIIFDRQNTYTINTFRPDDFPKPFGNARYRVMGSE